MLRRTVRILAAVAVVLAPSLAATAHADSTTPTGWVRLAHLSPDTPPVDVYLYAFGGKNAQILLRHVAYGATSPYESLPPGLYLVAMRGAGAADTADPVISTQIQVTAGQAYTVAGLGPAAALTLEVLQDKLDPPAGKASVRLIEASLRDPSVSITAGDTAIATDLRFPAVTDYRTVGGGAWPVRVSTPTAAATSRLTFAPGSTYTLAVLDNGAGAPRLLDLGDASGTTALPQGGVATGLGGTATEGLTARDAQWVALFAAATAGALAAARRLRRR